MTLSSEDRCAITDLVNLHGHLVDRGDFDGLSELFTEDVVYDVSALGGEVMIGLRAGREAALALGDRNPLGHHVTNIVLQERGAAVRVVSKALGVMSDGSVGSLTYEDTVERRAEGWRISHRVIRPRKVPLQP